MSRIKPDSDELRGVYLPLEEGQLLLPNAAVAEVMSYREPTRIPETPDWFIGELEWRFQTIPVVSFEKALSLTESREGRRTKIAICNTLNGSSELPFIGIITKSMPRLVRVREDNIVKMKREGDLDSLVLQEVLLQGEKALIPDLDRLEDMVQHAIEQIATP